MPRTAPRPRAPHRFSDARTPSSVGAVVPPDAMIRWASMARTLCILLVSACSFNPPSNTQPIDSGPIDVPPDMPEETGGCESVATTCSDGLTLRTCLAAHAQPILESCAWGCKDTPDPHCG